MCVEHIEIELAASWMAQTHFEFCKRKEKKKKTANEYIFRKQRWHCHFRQRNNCDYQQLQVNALPFRFSMFSVAGDTVLYVAQQR